MNAASLPSPAPGSSRRTLFLVVALLTLPFALGAGLYLSGWHPGRAGNHGELLQPPLPLTLTGTTTAETRGKWLLVLSGSGPCDTACAGRIDEMRRVQVSLNKDMGRLRRLVVTPHPGDPALVSARAAQPDLLFAAPESMPTPLAAAPGYRLYVADPQGNLVLRYAPDAAAKDVRSDLDRLLKFAWTG